MLKYLKRERPHCFYGEYKLIFSKINIKKLFSLTKCLCVPVQFLIKESLAANFTFSFLSKKKVLLLDGALLMSYRYKFECVAFEVHEFLGSLCL